MKQIVKVVLFTWLLAIGTVATSHARDVTIQWSDADTTVTGYKVYYNADTAGPPFSGTGSTLGASPIDVKNVTSATVTGLDPSHAYYFAITAYNSAGVESGYSNVVNVLEAVAPTVSITSPASNSTATGTVSVTASATDNVGVTKVEFYVNGTLAATDTSTPYLYSWDTSALAAGTYTLMAKAYDAAGNVGQSANVSVSVVKDTTAPTVSITAPTNGATVSGTVAITATASDNVGVSKVEFYDNAALLSASNVAPYSYNWNTASAANGSHTLTAKAYDAAGNVGQSSVVTVTVNNTVADTTAPTVAISAPANGATVSGTTTVSATASDNTGVSKVEFYVNSALKATSTASPYSFSWDTTASTNGTYTLTVKAYDAAGNVGQSANVTVSVSNTSATSGTYTAIFGNATGTNYANTVEDTFLNINNDVNATNTVLYTYTWPAYTPANATVTKWNLSALPAGAQIQSATLYLYMTGGGGDALYEVPVSEVINKTPVITKCNGNTYDGVNAWTASSVPYGGVPLAQSDIAPAVDAPQLDTTLGYKSWNVTNIVKDWITTPSNNRGLLLDGSKKATADSYRTFASSEALDATQRPKLVVTYTLASSTTADTTAPTVAISAPANGATVSGTATVTASASDNTGVTKVEFYVNGTLKTTSTTAPYSFSWDTTTSANGAYTLTARAYDAAGNVGQSAGTSVTVSNSTSVADTTAPVVTIVSPAAGAKVGRYTTISASATDNTAVTRMELYIDNALMTTTTSGSLAYTWNVARGSHVIKVNAYDAAGNVGSKSESVNR